MSTALNKMLEKSGLEAPAKASKKKATDMVTVDAPKDIKAKVDRFLELDELTKNQKTEMELVCAEIRNFATDYIVKNHETENLILPGTTGEVNVNMKDQYNNITDPEQYKQVKSFLDKRKIDVAGRITEESSISFDFNKLTQVEQEKLMNFLTKELGSERFNQVCVTKTVYKLSNLKDEMIKKVKSVKEFNEFREMTAHHNLTIAKRTTK
jgi:hypothetical protein